MRKIVTIVCLLVLALVGAGFSVPAQAEETGTHVHKMPPAPESWGEAFKDIWNRDKLTGDWGSDLHGLDVDLRRSHYYQNVASGGVNENGEYGRGLGLQAQVSDGRGLSRTTAGKSIQAARKTTRPTSTRGVCSIFSYSTCRMPGRSG